MESTTEVKVTRLAPGDDVVLGFDDGTGYQVASSVLTSASPVFAAMFGPKFSEGQGLRNESNPSL